MPFGIMIEPCAKEKTHHKSISYNYHFQFMPNVQSRVLFQMAVTPVSGLSVCNNYHVIL